MSGQAVHGDIQIGRTCSAAICEEIGDRLRITMMAGPSGMPRDIAVLVEQIERTDDGFRGPRA